MWRYFCMKKFYVYILTNKNNKVLYIGVTNNLIRRVCEHENKLVKGFTKKYNVTKLIYFEEFTSAHEAISREKQLKKWRRDKKLSLIKKVNENLSTLNEIITN